MASVWEAKDELLDRSVAVKLLASHLSEDDRARQRFQREARAAASVSSHPNVVTIYDVGDHDGRTFMVMELLAGGTLADRLRDHADIPTEQAVTWLREAAGALDAAHAAGIVHRDVKPANMLLDDQGRLAIADFGIARLALEDQLTATGTVLGTAAYISPEQAVGDGATAASDRYALAVVAFELLTGERPFQAENFAAQARAHVEDPPPHASELNQSLSPAVDGVLERGLAKDPDDRWASSGEFVDALEQSLHAKPARTGTTRRLGGTAPPRRPAPAPAPVPGNGPPAPARAAGPRRRGSGALLLAVLAGVAVIVALAAILLSGGGSNTGNTARGTPTATAKKKATATPSASTPTPTPSPAATPGATPSASPAPSGTPDLNKARQLQIAGFNARNGGDYNKDLQLAQQALDACAGSTSMDPCGYAMFEKGLSLSKLGRYDEAVQVLQQRLDTFGDNPKGEVAKELQTAKKKAGKG